MAGLSRRHQQAVHALLRERQARVPLNEQWQALFAHFEVGEPRGKWLHFSPEQRRTLQERARQEWGFDPIEALPDGTRAQVAQLAIDEKTARLRPDDFHVLVKGYLPAPLPSLPAELSLRIPITSLALEAVTQLVMVENLDSFDHWSGYNTPPQVANALILYRGHGGLARGARRLLEALPASTAVTFFGDYDPAGLAIAASLPKVSAVLMPQLDSALLSKNNRAHFHRQTISSRYLDNTELHNWQSLWQDIKLHQASIKQQHMLALGTTLLQVHRYSQ